MLCECGRLDVGTCHVSPLFSFWCQGRSRLPSSAVCGKPSRNVPQKRIDYNFGGPFHENEILWSPCRRVAAGQREERGWVRLDASAQAIPIGPGPDTECRDCPDNQISQVRKNGLTDAGIRCSHNVGRIPTVSPLKKNPFEPQSPAGEILSCCEPSILVSRTLTHEASKQASKCQSARPPTHPHHRQEGCDSFMRLGINKHGWSEASPPRPCPG
ncbi:hypothetical protein LY78DRAFT_434266 [Colletotrichum sublineola]|nr:hypothetical protein LY78DRAFT_434266 [Colletotrichum sublineola]